MTPERVRYCIVRDGDGHHWLCPVERRDEAVKMIAYAEEYRARGLDMRREDYKDPVDPDEVD